MVQRRLGSWLVATAAAVLVTTVVVPARVAADATTIREPAFGLPHLFADTDLELSRENGREIAKDRLGQLILLSRVGRGNLYQAFGILDPSTLSDDIEARRTAYTSSELNNMYAKLPQRERDMVIEYCKGVNDTIDAIYGGTLPEPIEVDILRNVLGLSDDLFGNKNNISDQVDPNYAPAGGEWPNAGFQFTPEMVAAVAILEIRNFGINDFGEASRFSELQNLINTQGATNGPQIWDDLNFLNDPLAPVTVPDPTTPGYGGPLSLRRLPLMLATTAFQFPAFDYAAAAEQQRRTAADRAEFAIRLGAWPMLGSYAWVIAGNKSATGNPWLGGFPQTGIQTPSLMHFAENRSAEGQNNRINGIGMEFAGAPFVLIGQTDRVAYTSTTAQLRIIDSFFERIVNESADSLRYNDMGTPAPLKQRVEFFDGGLAADASRTFFRTHERNGNGGSRAVNDFIGDREGTADSGTSNSLVDASAFDGSYVGGHVAIVGRTGTNQNGVGQIREITSVPDNNTIIVGTAWTFVPDNTFQYAAAKPGKEIIAVSLDNPVWLEETTGALGFLLMQRSESIFDIRAAARVMPSTHNFPAVDNQPFNGVGTMNGNGNIGYWSSGFSRKRQGGLDPRLPLDGSAATNPLVVVDGSVDSATPTTLTATSGVFSSNFAPPALNFRYDNPTQIGSEYIVAITSGTGYRQTRRIASNSANTLTVEFPWAVTPAGGDTFEVYEIAAMPEAINPSEGYMANWNNKAATADEGENFGRQFRHLFILERLAADNAWDRDKNRQLNKDVAGLDGRGDFGRYLIPRLREAVDGVGNGGNPDVDTVLAALEAHIAAPYFGRNFIDPVLDTTNQGEVSFLNQLVNRLAQDIYSNEFTGAVSVPTGARALNIVQHAIDSAAGDLPGAYGQAYGGDYFNGTDWRVVVRNSLSALATTPGIPADSTRNNSNYAHPLSALFPSLVFEPTLNGNRGTYEQIIEVGQVVNGEFMFPLGQSGLVEGSISGVTSIDPNVDSLQPIWRDWRFVPMLHVAQDLGRRPDAFMCYKTKNTPGTDKFAAVDASLTDAFETGTVTVKKPKELCAPADAGPDVRDATTYLQSYLIKAVTPHTKQTSINIEDQFGTLSVDTVKPMRLFIPSTTALGAAPITEPLDLVDHYKCYKIKVTPGTQKFVQTQVAVVDQLQTRLYDIKKPLRLCMPVNKDGEEIVSPTGHLMCYKAKPAEGEPDHVRVEGQIHVNSELDADDQVDTVKETELCVPAIRDGAEPDGDLDDDAVLDAFERWYYGNTAQLPTSDTDGDGATLLDEFTAGSDPTDDDTDDDGTVDGSDGAPQDRLVL